MSKKSPADLEKIALALGTAWRITDMGAVDTLLTDLDREDLVMVIGCYIGWVSGLAEHLATLTGADKDEFWRDLALDIAEDAG